MNGLQYYLVTDDSGEEQLLPEPKISGNIELSSPSQRLLSGQIDRNRAYRLRIATLHFRYQSQQSSARGLLGSRTNLIPHQVYIAHEVASRFAPRVLLADEVGLGKTIESGMILHHQLQTAMARRCLIIVPDALLHQWLVEMLRRFNLPFSLFDQPRIDALRESGGGNPFESEQLILCSLSLLCNHEDIANEALTAPWDIVVVDEAHHLAWSAEKPSDEYLLIEKFSRCSAGLLLLTATPEQVGIDSHFARLKLLDPSRFDNLDTFKSEQNHYESLNDFVRTLQSERDLSSEQIDQLGSLLGNALPDTQALQDHETREKIVQQLLDRHGTGRVLFRNTRAAIEHFPARQPLAYSLPVPADYRDAIAATTTVDEALYPERLLQADNRDWIAVDPRVSWLEGLLKELRPEKVLLICSSAQTAIDLERHLHLDIGIRSAAFYEDLSIIERDRAAAYFAEQDSGAQVLICSEIGSEGRNFQFAHHLVLFDLPLNPDLLEQRIGRLDRIGQNEDIKIHIPYLECSAQDYLYRWYDGGLNAFKHSFSAGLSVFDHFADRLQPLLIDASGCPTANTTTDNSFTALVDDAQRHSEALRETLSQGRDRLLELNSCNPSIAADVIEAIRSAERSDILQSYMAMVFDIFGVDHDFHSDHCLVLRPTDHMLSAYFPGLREEGTTVTFDRDVAQLREDMQFLTWEHPMVSESMEMILGSELGNTAIGAIKLKSIPAGTVLLEAFFTVHSTAPASLQLQRFLPAMPIRVLLASTGKDLTDTIKHSQLNKLCEHVKKSSRPAIIKQVRPILEQLASQAQDIARDQIPPLIDAAMQQTTAALNSEVERLQELQRLNGSVRDEEILYFQQRLQDSLAYIQQAGIDLQGLRLVINT